MRPCSWFNIIFILITADTIASLIQNKTKYVKSNSLKETHTRRKGSHKHADSHKKSLSTSSEPGDHRSTEGSAMSLGISSDSSSSSSKSNRGYINKPKSSEERRGWRKWHRKCSPCPDDMVKKWRDRTINWICGGYQRARRSFKSECMMHYRNCQDGTMFVKIHDYRCENDTGTELRHGLHFFYEYGKDSQDSRSDSSGSTSMHISSEFYQ